jgi:hypothetical protein
MDYIDFIDILNECKIGIVFEDDVPIHIQVQLPNGTNRYYPTSDDLRHSQSEINHNRRVEIDNLKNENFKLTERIEKLEKRNDCVEFSSKLQEKLIANYKADLDKAEIQHKCDNELINKLNTTVDVLKKYTDLLEKKMR